MPSPTQRSIKHLEESGHIVAIVERFIWARKIRIDCFGCGDLLAAGPGGIILVQTASTSNLSAHVHKALRKSRRRLKVWLEAGGKFHLHGWALRGPSYRKKEWTLRLIEITLADLQKPKLEDMNGESEYGEAEEFAGDGRSEIGGSE